MEGNRGAEKTASLSLYCRGLNTQGQQQKERTRGKTIGGTKKVVRGTRKIRMGRAPNSSTESIDKR